MNHTIQRSNNITHFADDHVSVQINMASKCSPANLKTYSSSVHTHTCLGNTGVTVATVTTILYHKSYKLSIHYPWKWTQTFMVRSQWLSYDRAGTHNVIYTNSYKNLGVIQSRPLGGHVKGLPLPVYWPGNCAQTHKTVEWQTASQCYFKHSQYNKILHVVSFINDACDVPVCWSHQICLFQTQDFFLRYTVFCIFSHQWANKAFFKQHKLLKFT